jgi:pilus assembly protein CpaC
VSLLDDRHCRTRTALLSATLAALVGLLLSAFSAFGTTIEIAGKRTGSVRVTMGKSESVRIDRSFVDVMIGDADIADAIPLTDRSLSIHGKKIGSTRLSLYGDGKTLVGVIDVEVSYDTAQLAEELAQRFPRARFRVSSANGRLLLAGSAPDAVTVDRAVVLAKQFAPDVINTVRVLQAQQVMLEVRFVEVSRTAGRELGVNWEAVSNNLLLGGGGFAAATGLANPISGKEQFGTFLGRMLGSGVQIDMVIRALEGRGLARRLAEPNLVALSGDTASFLAGGEIPIPVQSTLGMVTIEYKKFGVGLAFTPTVLDNGVINLKIEPEVSQLDPVNFIQAVNVRIPAIIVRRANTTIELRDGQSFAMAGLLHTESTTDQGQLPWIGDIPVLGTLFRSAAFQKKETDLAIIVTPRLVRPIRPGDTLKTPLDNTANGNDPDVFLLGQGEVTARQRGLTREYRQVGHILNLSKGAQSAAP